MRDDYVITIFSRRHGRTRTVRLKRRSLSWALAAAGLLVFLVTLALGYGVLRLILERRQLQAKVSHFEQVLHNQEERAQHQQARKPTEKKPSPASEGSRAESQVSPPPQRESGQTVAEEAKSPETMKGRAQQQAREPTEEKPSPASEGSRAESRVAPPPQRESGQTVAEEAKSPETIKVGIENPTAISLGGDDDWFRFEVKIKNLGGKPVLGAMAIIATCIPSVQPHFISSPPMEVGPDGLPANVRKSARFSIRNFRHMRGTFRLSFAQVESFRVLIYDASWHLVLDTIIPSAQVEARGVSSAQSS
jgi:hypothetical protein